MDNEVINHFRKMGIFEEDILNNINVNDIKFLKELSTDFEKILYKKTKRHDELMEELKEGIKYVAKNYDLFLKHYNDKDGNFDDEDLFNALIERGEMKNEIRQIELQKNTSPVDIKGILSVIQVINKMQRILYTKRT